VPSYAGAELSLKLRAGIIWYGDSSDSIDSQFGPSSMHTGVVGHLYGDGSGPLHRRLDRRQPVSTLLITRAGGEVLDALP